MDLRAALAAKGNSPEQVEVIMTAMTTAVSNGYDPEDVLWENANLEADYVFDLLDECT